MYSFIVPIYKAEAYIKPCVESIIAQTISDWELILVDDGSPDESGSICDKFADEYESIKVVHQENSGVSVARNNGLQHAKGDWIIFVDADDWVEANLCEQLNSCCKQNTDIMFFTYQEESQNKIVDFSKKYQGDKICTYYNKADIDRMQKAILHKHLCNYTSVGAPWAKAFRRSLIEEHELQFPVGMVKGEDHLFNLQAYEYADNALYMNKALYHYRITGSSARHKYNPDIIPIIRKQYSRIWEFIQDNNKQEELEEAYYYAVFRRFMVDSMIDFCHPDNEKPYKVRKKEYIEAFESEPFATANRKTDISDWPLKEKILGFCMRRHWFGMICLLYDIKNIIFKAH